MNDNKEYINLYPYCVAALLLGLAFFIYSFPLVSLVASAFLTPIAVFCIAAYLATDARRNSSKNPNAV